jgi:hypothetical protein
MVKYGEWTFSGRFLDLDTSLSHESLSGMSFSYILHYCTHYLGSFRKTVVKIITVEGITSQCLCTSLILSIGVLICHIGNCGKRRRTEFLDFTLLCFFIVAPFPYSILSPNILCPLCCFVPLHCHDLPVVWLIKTSFGLEFGFICFTSKPQQITVTEIHFLNRSERELALTLEFVRDQMSSGGRQREHLNMIRWEATCWCISAGTLLCKQFRIRYCRGKVTLESPLLVPSKRPSRHRHSAEHVTITYIKHYCGLHSVRWFQLLPSSSPSGLKRLYVFLATSCMHFTTPITWNLLLIIFFHLRVVLVENTLHVSDDGHLQVSKS